MKRCIVADDHPALLQALCDFVAAEGYDVAGSAPDGEAALALVERERPDVAVVDFRMPRLGGLELVERLRRVAPNTQIVVYTAEADEAAVRGALALGAAALLLKESPLSDLSRALDAAAGGGSYLDPVLAAHAVGLHQEHPGLTERELEVLTLVAEGLTHEEIGARLKISAETARTHVRKASRRLGAATRTQAVATALRLGLID